MDHKKAISYGDMPLHQQSQLEKIRKEWGDKGNKNNEAGLSLQGMQALLKKYDSLESEMQNQADLDPYHPASNPSGFLNTMTAENTLMLSEWTEKVQKVLTEKDGLPEDVLEGGDLCVGGT